VSRKQIFAGLATNVRKFNFEEINVPAHSHSSQTGNKSNNENHNRYPFNSGINILILLKRTNKRTTAAQEIQ